MDKTARNKFLPAGIVVGLIANIICFAVSAAASSRIDVANQQLFSLKSLSSRQQNDIDRLNRYQATFDQMLDRQRSPAQNRLYWQTLFDQYSKGNVEQKNTPLTLERRERLEWHKVRFSPFFRSIDSDTLSAIELFATSMSFDVTLADEATVLHFLYRLVAEQDLPVAVERCVMSLRTSLETDLVHTAVTARTVTELPQVPPAVRLQCDARYYEITTLN